MVDRVSGSPRIGRVAIFAHVAGLHMAGILAGCVGTVVTAGTVACDIHVVEIGGQPARRRVAVLTVVAAADVCRGLSGRDLTVMARAA